MVRHWTAKTSGLYLVKQDYNSNLHTQVKISWDLEADILAITFSCRWKKKLGNWLFVTFNFINLIDSDTSQNHWKFLENISLCRKNVVEMEINAQNINDSGTKIFSKKQYEKLEQ